MDGDLPPGDARSIPARNAGCIVLAPPDTAAGDDILEGLLRDRGYASRTLHDPLAAMVELCLMDRAHETGAAWGHASRVEPALVIVPPGDDDACRAARDLVAAVQRYLPRPRVWMYTAGALAPLVGRTTPSPAISAPPPPPPSRADAPVSRPGPMPAFPPPTLADSIAEPASAEPPPEPDTPAEVTADEISMLFDGPAEERRG
ncbi:MAG: hypothetical protein GY715_07665 [Planctomycetes bacterium]|nr:hypothetical protein [Planctomycetota bacterium]